MHSAYKLNKQGDNTQPWRTPFPIWNQSVVPCPVLTCFLTCIRISQEADQVVWYSHLFQNFPQFVVIHTIKGFGVINKAEVDGFSGTLLLFPSSSILERLLSLGHIILVATGLEKVSFHSNHKERQCQRMLKLLHNCTHLASEVMLKILQARLQQWTMNFQMFKLDLKKEAEPEIKLPTSAGS